MFSSVALEHIQRPRGRTAIGKVTHRGRAGTEGDGPFLYIDLEVKDGVVQQAFFQSLACPASIACGSILSEIAVGRELASLVELEEEDLVLLLGGLPEGKRYCAALAVSALRDAATNEVAPQFGNN